MYTESTFHASAGQVESLLSLSKGLDLAQGSGGLRISDKGPSRKIYEPFIKEAFPGFVLEDCFLVVLWPSQHIVGHVDQFMKGARYHIPLQLNDQCWFLHNSTWSQLEVGQCYKINPAEWHGAVNWGRSIRINLVFDISPKTD